MIALKASMIEKQGQALSAVAKTILKATRPEEAILVDALICNQSRLGDDEILGFGMGPEIALLAPVLIDFLKDASKSSLKTLAEQCGEYLAKKVTSPSHPKLDPSKLVRIRSDLSERLSNGGFEPDEVSRIGDSLVSVLIENPDLLRELVG